MILIFVAFFLTAFVGLWCIISNNISLSLKSARLCRTTLLVTSALGAVGSILSIIIYNLSSSGEKGDGFAQESFNGFAGFLAVFVGIALGVTLLSSVLGLRMRPVIVIVLPLWGVISLFIGVLCSLWLSFSDAKSTLYFSLYSVCITALLSFPSFIEMGKRVKLLSNENERNMIISNRRSRVEKSREKARRRKELAKKKKRLKNGK